MPEAGEVTVATRQLAELAVGRELIALDVTHPRTSRAQPAEALQRFAGGRIDAVRRHGKWLLVSFGGVPGELGVHLRMSGQLLAVRPGTPHPDRHVHAVLSLGPRADDGVEVWFRDPRTFGELRVLEHGAPVAPDLFDPEVTGDAVAAASARCTVGAKAVLLDQVRAVSGIGSYLADEALHRAGVSPLRPAKRLTADDWEGVLTGARAVAEASAAVGGVTLPDEGWVDLLGRPGRYATELRVHGRDECMSCGTPTCRASVGGRSARWCPVCQVS